MREAWSWLALAGLIAFAIVWQRRRLRKAARTRLAPDRDEEEAPAPAVASEPSRSVLSRRGWLPPVVGVAVAACVRALLPIDWLFALTFGAMVAAVTWLVAEFLAARRIALLESRLADAIDLIVGSLRAGIGIMQALDSSARETRAPLRVELEELVGRIRLGDEPKVVLQELSERIPIEAYLLFTFALSVHWEVGGSLAPTLATVGRTVRDRIELGRRVRSQTMEAQVSVIGVLLVTYAIALIMWKTNPERMASFVGSSLGGALVSSAILMQTVGVVWMSRISRIRF